MKVIHLMDTLGVFGGVNSFVYDLCKELKMINVDVSIIGILSKSKNQDLIEELQACGIKVFCLDAPGKKEAVLHYRTKLRNTIKMISANEETIVNCHLRLGTLMGAIAVKGLKNVKCVETYHSQYPHYWLQYNLCKRRICKYIACSVSAMNEFAARFHPKKDKLIAIQNGIDSASIRNITGNPASEYPNETVFLSVGRFTNQKNFLVSIGAYLKANLQSSKYVIIGSGPEEIKLRETAKDNANVIFTGPVSRQRVLEAVRTADMVVMPSLLEGLSIFMLETLALGCPMMISNEAALRDVFHEQPLKVGETWRKCKWGYVVDTSNEEAYSEAMTDFIASKDVKQEMHREIERLADEYDIKVSACSYKKIYENLTRNLV